MSIVKQTVGLENMDEGVLGVIVKFLPNKSRRLLCITCSVVYDNMYVHKFLRLTIEWSLKFIRNIAFRRDVLSRVAYPTKQLMLRFMPCTCKTDDYFKLDQLKREGIIKMVIIYHR